MKVLLALLSLALASPALAQVPGPSAPLPSPAAGYGKTDGVIPGVLFGPKLALSLPTPGFGVEVKARNLFGFSFDYGLIPDVTIEDVTVGMTNWAVGAKVYPFRGAFFLGAQYGRREFSGSASDDTPLGRRTADVEVTSSYIAPEIGWRWVWNSGLFLGMNFGWQFVIDDSVSANIPAELLLSSPDTVKDVTDAADDIGKAGLPVLGLLQIGWFF